MQRAIQLALKGKGRTSPNPMVGSVVVKNSRIVGEGWHRQCGGDHAEIIALEEAGKRAIGAKLYITLEPCFHYGRTPPCVHKIIGQGIREVVIGMKDPNPLTQGKSIRLLKRENIKTTVGVLEKDCRKMNEIFEKYITQHKPFVVAKCAQTLDGKTATAQGQSQWITSEQSRRFARKIRDEFDSILVGINTVLKDNPRLNPARKTKRLKKIILDSRLRIPSRSRLFHQTAPEDIIIATTSFASKKRMAYFHQKGVTVIICPQREGRVEIQWLMSYLAGQEILSVLIEGGAQVIGAALKARCVDKFHIYIAPKIMGDHKAKSCVAGMKMTDVNQAIHLEHLEIQPIKEDFFIQAYVHGNR